MDPTPPFPVNEPLESAPAGGTKGPSLFLISSAVLIFFLILFSVLYYFDTLSLGFKLPFLPQKTVSAPTPLPTPSVVEVNPDYPALPLPLTHPTVQGASVYYRLSGKVEEVNALPSGDLTLKLIQQEEVLPMSFTVSSKQTVVTENGKGFAGFSLDQIKVGDSVELIYLVDLKTYQTLVTQVQVEKGE